MKHQDKKVWLVEHPLHQFKEDVKALAQRGQLRIIDMKYKNSIRPESLSQEAPKLTRKTATKIKEEREQEQAGSTQATI